MKRERQNDIPKFYFVDTFESYHKLFQDNCFSRRLFKKGTGLLSMRYDEDICIYIESGWALYSVTHANGKEKNLFLFGKGMLFPTYMSPKQYHIGEKGTALTDIEGLVLSQKKLRQLMYADNILMKRIMDNYMEMFNYLVFDTANSSFNSAYIRVCNLLELFSHYMRETGSRTINISQEDLARFIGISRVQASHVINELKKSGIIKTSRNQIIVNDEEKLREYCTSEILLEDKRST